MLFFITTATSLQVTICCVSSGGAVELRAAIELGFIEDDIDRGLNCCLEEGGGRGVGEDGRMLMGGGCVFV